MIAAAITIFSLNASAVITPPVDVPTDGSWIQFDFDQAGSALYDLSTQSNSFSFNLSQPGVLRAVDLGFSGDQFTIFANGASLGLTSTPVAQSVDQQFDAPIAWNNARWSKGSWNLAAGTYTITGIATLSPYDGGYGAMSVVAVPEPESWAMLLAGLGMVGAIARRRLNRHA